jgi:elongation factor Ts
MPVSAQDVKRLRDLTDAPMGECKAALEEAGGDLERAKDILREKGKAAASKRSGRSTGAGAVAVSHSANNQEVGAVVLESETDFVSKNEGFVNLAKELAEIFQHNDPGSDPLAVKHGDRTVGELIEGAVATFRENIKLTKALHLHSDSNTFAAYIHHSGDKGSIVEIAGTPSNGHAVGRDVAIQTVAFPAEYVSKDQVPAEFVEKQIELETKRAMDEGKPENIAKNIAQGRVNKEIMQQVVLMEQPFYKELSKTVGAYISEEAKSAGTELKVVSFHRLTVGDTGDAE